MPIRYFALVYGIVFLLVGLAGFVPAFVTPYETGDPELAINASSGLLFGLFPVNILHNVVHVAFGIWGIAAYRSLGGSLTYARAVAVVYAIFAVMGFIPGLNTVFGLVPLHSHDVWLHILLALPAVYFGWFANIATAEPEKPR